MRDRLFESETFGQPLDLARYARPVVLAPHPDDEVFGCGGLLALWAERGIRPRVVLLTAGQAQVGSAPDAQARVAESAASAQLLGCQVEAWNLEDRQVRCNDALIGRIADWIRDSDADVVLCPALTEPHPDHQAATLALCCALARAPRTQVLPDVLLYESGAALTHPNRLVDITPVADTKARAVAAFDSQEAAQPYASRIAARDHFRGMTLGRQARAAEAFTLLPAREQGWPAVVAGLEPLYLHGRGQAASEHDLPLVSVLIRTVGDPHLERTLAAVAAQTYARLEVVVVVARGEPQAETGWPERADAPLRWVRPGGALSRPQAANACLQAATGEWLIFLDDDDLWAPDHVEKLVRHRRSRVACAAVHTDAAVIDPQGRELTRYDQPYSPHRLAFTNTFPIHTVLFERRLVTEAGCRFDETLPVLEDWDFWLQVTRHTDVAHVPGVSAFYRWSDRSRLNAEDDRHHQRQWRDQVQARWMARWPQETVLAAIRWYTGQLDRVMQEHAALGARVAGADARIQETQWALEAAQARLRDTQAELAQAGASLARQAADLEAAQQRAERAEGLLRDTRAELALAGASLERAEAKRAALIHRAQAAEALLQDTHNELALAGASLQRLEAEHSALQQREAAGLALLQDTRTELALAGASLQRLEAEHSALQQREAAGLALLQDTRTELALAGQSLARAFDQSQEQQGRLRGQELQLQALRQEAAQLSLHLDSMQRSVSWRITRPLRWLSTRLHRSR